MDNLIRAIELDRRAFLSAAAALAATAAAPPTLASDMTRLAPEIDGALAAWVRWSPGKPARVVIGHRSSEAATYLPVADRTGAVVAAPAQAIAAGRQALAAAVAPGWGAAPEACQVSRGEIRHEPSGRAVAACIWLALGN